MRNLLKHIYRPAVTLFIACAALLLSCTKEPAPGGEPGGDPEETVYISLGINAGDGVKNTKSDPGQTGNLEYQIDTVRMVLYGPDDKVHYAFNFSIRSNPVANTYDFIEGDGVSAEYGHDLYSSSIGEQNFVTYARKVARNDYKMLIILNGISMKDQGQVPTLNRMNRANSKSANIFDITEVGQPLSRLLEPVEIDPDSLFSNITRTRSQSVPTNASILMTNYQGLVTVKAEQLGSSIQNANENPIFVRVERYLAKIIVTTLNDDGVIGLAGDAASSGKAAVQNGGSWATNCTNKWTYWMRRLAPEIRADGTVDYNDLEVPNYDPDVTPSRINLYAWDPNFENMSDANGGSASERRSNFHYIAYSDRSPSTNNLHSDNAEYVLENTSAHDDHDDTKTSVIVQLKFTPDTDRANFDYDGYFIFPNNFGNDELITFMEMLDYIADPGTIPATFPGLGDAINNIQAAGIDMQNMINGSVTYGFDMFNLKYYYDYTHFYTVPIVHYNDYTGGVDPETAYGRYGVVRNNVYTVRIRSVSGPGAPSPYGYPAYLSYNISVMPWMKHAQGEDIGSPVKPVP